MIYKKKYYIVVLSLFCAVITITIALIIGNMIYYRSKKKDYWECSGTCEPIYPLGQLSNCENIAPYTVIIREELTLITYFDVYYYLDTYCDVVNSTCRGNIRDILCTKTFVLS